MVVVVGNGTALGTASDACWISIDCLIDLLIDWIGCLIDWIVV